MSNCRGSRETQRRLRFRDFSPKRRRLDDEDLDSGDDEGWIDRIDADEEQQDGGEYRERNVIDAAIGRHAVPNPSDGEVRAQYPTT